MAGSLGALILELSANTVRWEQDMGRAAHVTARSTEQMTRMFGSVKRAVDTLLVGGGITLFLREMSQAAAEAQQQDARLEATLRATGHTAGLTKYQLDELAESMARTTQFDDEGIREAQSTLIKFGNIQSDVFTRALELSADWASFTKRDMAGAAQELGRALAAPSAGLTFLERNMGKFTDAQREAIRAAEEQGRLWDAQKIILDEVANKVGGTAKIINDDYTKAMTGATKAYDDFLESVGRSKAAQSTAESFLGFVKDSFTDLKEIVENGDWVEKTLAIMAFAAGFRGFKLTPQPKDGGAPGAAGAGVTPEQAAAAAEEARQKALLAAAQKEAQETSEWWIPLQLKEEERRRAELAKMRRAGQGAPESEVMKLRRRLEDDPEFNLLYAGDQAGLDKLFKEAARADEARAERQFREQLAEDQGAFDRHVAERQRAEQQALADGRVEMWRQVYAEIDAEQERAIEQGQELLAGLEAREKEAASAAKELGLTFASAFEDAIVQGKELSDVLKGLAMDVARIFARKMITEPTAELFTNIAKGAMSSGGGGLFSGLFGAGTGAAGAELGGLSAFSSGWAPDAYVGFAGAFADGGDFTVGGAGGTDSQLVAFRASPGENVSIRKPGQADGATYFIDARGADAAGLARLERRIEALNGSIERRAVSAVANARQRGGAASRAIG
jgi:hypothetical protein